MSLSQTGKSIRANDDVINQPNPQQIPSFYKGLCYVNIVVAWSQRTGRMIVSDNNRICICQDSRFKNLPRVHETRRYAELGITAIIPS